MIIAHYPLNGDAKDLTGKYDATSLSGITWSNGKVGQAADTSSTNSGYIYNGSNGWKISGDFSFALWAKREGSDGSSYGGLMSTHHHSPVPTAGVSFYMSSTGNFIRIATGDGSSRPAYSVTMPDDVDLWNHYALTCKDNVLSVYQNGVLIDSRTSPVSSINHVPSHGWIIGRWATSYSTYNFKGRLDDARVYDHALSEREVRDLARGIVVHYTLNNSTVVDSTGNYPVQVNTSALDETRKAIGSASRLFTTQVLSNDQVFLGSDPIFTVSAWIRPDSYSGGGFWGLGSNGNAISCYTTTSLKPGFDEWGSVTYYANYTLPTDKFTHIVWVKKGTGEFNSSKLEVWINGVEYPLIQTRFTSVTANVSSGLSLGRIAYNLSNYHANGNIDDFRLYSSALSQMDIKELYQTGLAVDDHHRIHSTYLNESGIINPNMLDYTTWKDSSTGSASGFDQNGATAENYRVQDVDPFGKEITAWEARPQATSGADGGWNSSYHSIDNTKMHRFSVWIRRTVVGGGSYYFGTNGGGSNVLNRDNGGANGNPYFRSGGWGFGSNRWVLLVGHVWPAGSGTGSFHPDSGVYTVDDGRIGGIGDDFVCASGTISLRHRSYLYYSTNTSTRQQWCYPRIDVCDGTEPSIEALLTGFDSLNYDRTHDELGSTSVPDNLGVKRGHTDVGQFSEVGITRGMVSWFPLKGDAKDRVTNDVAAVTGAVATADGYIFDGVDDEISTPLDSTFSTESHTVIAWVKYDSIVGTGGAERKGMYYANGAWTPGLWADNTEIRAHCVGLYATASWTQTTEWRMVGQVFDKEANVLYVIIDGELFTGTQTSYSPTAQGGLNIGTASTAAFPGLIRGVKTFDKALTPEEVAQEYQSSSKSMINKSTAFAKEFIEV